MTDHWDDRADVEGQILAEREALAREEHRHDVAMGNYWDDDDYPSAS